MATHEWVQDYLDTVGAQIRWKRARPAVLRELNDHLQDQCQACLDEGLTQEAAREEALRQMGDPVEVGRHLDAIHRPKGNREIIGVVLTLLTMNLVIWLTIFNNGDLERWLWMPLGCMGVGLIAMAVCSRIPWNLLLRHIGLLASLGWIVLLVLGELFFPDGSSRWPDYLAILLPLVYGALLYDLRKIGPWGLSVCGLILAGMLWFCDRYCLTFLGMASLVVTALVMTLLTVCQGSFGKGTWIKWSVMAMFAAVVVSYWRGFRNVFALEDRLLGEFYGGMCAELLKHVRLVGPGEPFTFTWFETTYAVSPGSHPFRHVMESDFFLSTVMYEYGWIVGAILVMAVLSLLVWCFCRGLKQPTLWSRLLSCAILIPMLLQTVVHVCNNCVLFLASAQLPLLSYGNTYRIMDLALLGVLMSAFRSKTIIRDTVLKRKLT